MIQFQKHKQSIEILILNSPINPESNAITSATESGDILLVNCEPALSRLARAALGEQHRVESAQTVEMALHAIGKRAYAIVLLEFSPIEQRSCEALQQLWACPQRPPLVVLTTDTSRETRRRLIGLGVAGLLYMPFTIDALRTTVADIVSRASVNPSPA